MADTKEELESRLEQLRSKRDKLNSEISDIKSRLDKDRSRELQAWLDGRADRQEWRFPYPGFAALDLKEFNEAGDVDVHVLNYNSDAGHQFKVEVDIDLGAYGSTPGEAWQQLAELLGTVANKIKEKA